MTPQSYAANETTTIQLQTTHVHTVPNRTALVPILSNGSQCCKKRLNGTQNYEKFQQNYLNIFSKIEKRNLVKFFIKKNNSQLELSSSQRFSE